MANTYHQMYIQAVFAVKYRQAIIEKAWKSKLLGVIGNLINESGCKTILVNGIEDHVHCFFGLKPTVGVSDLMKNVKAKSSKWVNENDLLKQRFEWQVGYGSFSYSHRDIDMIFHYIKNQEKHHETKTFNIEYRELLDEFNVDYDEKYLFDYLI